MSKREFLQRKQSDVKTNSPSPTLIYAAPDLLPRCWGTPRRSSWRARLDNSWASNDRYERPDMRPMSI